ncbi:Transcription factor 25 [Mortierella sp. NVP85]|nr:Transcription factor 25 [Mortierella sp. NVP85]
MSSRAMKNRLRDSGGPAPLKDLEHSSKDLRAENEEHEGQDSDEAQVEEDDHDDEYTAKQPPARNLFALLDEDDQGDDNDSDDNEKEPEVTTPVATSGKKKKNKKKKSGASSAGKAANPFDALKDDEDNDSTTPSTVEQGEDETISSSKSKSKSKKKKKGKGVNKTLEEMSVEEFEKSLQQANKQLGSLSTADGSSPTPIVTPLKQLLAIDTRFLDADAEMKRMFGARVVNSEIRDRRYAKVVKKALLAQPRNTWQVRRATGLSMDVVDTDEKEHITTFKIVHSEFYQRTQLKFLAAVASYEQALYAFEKSFHSLFIISSGSVRLSFMESENRSFFLALHRHIQFLGRRGCWRTAFEFNKLLLSLDPQNDPLGALLSIDFYALKAQEYNYLKRLYERLKQEHGLDRMPNFLYSNALAQFHLESTQGSTSSDKHEESSKLLQRAILMFPTAVPLLADQGNFSVDSEVAGEAAFYPATENFALWKEPEVIEWLKSNLRICVQSRFKNKNDPDVKDAKALITSLTSSASHKQKTEPVLSYGPDGMLESDASSSPLSQNDPWDISLRVCRHVLVSEYTSLARYLPEKIVRATMHMHDPLPPPGSRNVYEERFEEQRRNTLSRLMGGARDVAQNLEDAVRRFLAGGHRAGAGGENGAEAEAGGLDEAGLRRITEAVQVLQTQLLAGGREGGLPGAFPDQQQQAVPVAGAGNGTGVEAGAGTETGTGTGEAGGAAPARMTTEEANEIVTAFMNDLTRGEYHGEEEEFSDNEDEDQPFGPDGDDGWEPYDPAAYE